MKTTNKIHYVYKITNLNPTDERLYYIGVRSTSKESAELDINYRSSSKSLKAVIKEIGYNNFKKEILSTWETRKEAVQEEIRLHELNDVAKNPIYYNKSKQTSTGFDVSGMAYNKGNLTVLDTRDNKTKYITKTEFRDNSYYVSVVKGTIMAYDIKNKKNLRVSKEDYETNPNYVNINASKISIFDDKDNLVGCVYGGFKKYCLDNNYPYGSLYRSYQNDGSRLYQNKQYASRTQEEFKGWYAVKESIR